MSDTPTITIEFDADTADFVLMADSHHFASPAGPRLFRSPPHPRIRFHHDTFEAAQRDATTLRAYLANLKKPR